MRFNHEWQSASYITISPQDVSLGTNYHVNSLAGVARYSPVHLGLESSPFSSKYKSAHSSHTSPSYPLSHEHLPDPSLVPSPCKANKNKIKCSFYNTSDTMWFSDSAVLKLGFCCLREKVGTQGWQKKKLLHHTSSHCSQSLTRNRNHSLYKGGLQTVAEHQWSIYRSSRSFQEDITSHFPWPLQGVSLPAGHSAKNGIEHNINLTAIVK